MSEIKSPFGEKGPEEVRRKMGVTQQPEKPERFTLEQIREQIQHARIILKASLAENKFEPNITYSLGQMTELLGLSSPQQTAAFLSTIKELESVSNPATGTVEGFNLRSPEKPSTSNKTSRRAKTNPELRMLSTKNVEKVYLGLDDYEVYVYKNLLNRYGNRAFKPMDTGINKSTIRNLKRLHYLRETDKSGFYKVMKL